MEASALFLFLGPYADIILTDEGLLTEVDSSGDAFNKPAKWYVHLDSYSLVGGGPTRNLNNKLPYYFTSSLATIQSQYGVGL